MQRSRRWLYVAACWAACSAALWGPAPPCMAASLRYCDGPADISAAQQDKLFRFAAVIKAELDRTGQSVVLVSRAGLVLSHFGQRYSHAGFALKRNPDQPELTWAVRQLYFACEEKQSRLFDQGLSAFVMGAANPALGFVSVLLLPASAAAALETTVLDKVQALHLLSPHYSANAFAFSTQFQNCNQWVVEVLAAAWGELPSTPSPRLVAQNWLQTQGYTPTVFDVGWPLMWVSQLIPWLHQADHPAPDLDQRQYRVSMPASIEAFVQQQWPDAQRIEFCHNSTQVVFRQGWTPLDANCQATEGDTVVTLN
jgi:hypothetical protein